MKHHKSSAAGLDHHSNLQDVLIGVLLLMFVTMVLFAIKDSASSGYVDISAYESEKIASVYQK